MTEFCPVPLDTVTKRRFWESLDNRSRSLLSDRPDVLEAIFDTVRVRERYRADISRKVAESLALAAECDEIAIRYKAVVRAYDSAVSAKEE